MLTKKTKSGEKEIDVVPLIKSAEVALDSERGALRISAILRAASSEFLNPELLISGLRAKHGILCGDPMKESYSIMRTSIMLEDLKIFK